MINYYLSAVYFLVTAQNNRLSDFVIIISDCCF